MPKFKPHKGLLKRVRITKSGKVKCRVANGSHLRSSKPSKRLRHMRKGRFISNKGLLRRVVHLIGRAVEPVRDKTEIQKAET